MTPPITHRQAREKRSIPLLTVLATVIAGLVSVGAAPSSAHAVDDAAGVAAAALPPCFDFSTYAVVVTEPRVQTRHTYRPSLTNQDRNTNCRLRIGDAGPGVFVLQDALKRCNGHRTLAVDAQFGPLTRNAVIWEQARHGFPPADVDGVYGPQTRNAILWPVFVNGGPTFLCRPH